MKLDQTSHTSHAYKAFAPTLTPKTPYKEAQNKYRELFSEALAVSSLAQAEKLRTTFMTQHNIGRKAWAKFVEHVEAARLAIKQFNDLP
mgnify:CR=1 FL=1